jgi:endogenous inhibitor of DNA gyrase (YacG/DUF329 family)
MSEAKPRPPARSAEILPLRPPRPCAHCGKESTREFYPFCSKRCANIDLHRWLTGGYAIAAVEGDSADEADSS